MTTVQPDDFYEEDESIEKIVNLFEAGDKQLTRPPRGHTRYLYFDPTPGPSVVTTARAVIHGSEPLSTTNS